MVRRRPRRVDQLPALLSNRAAGRIRLCALARFAAPFPLALRTAHRAPAASLAFLHIAPRADTWKPASAADPSGRILLLLAATVGAPYFLLSATSPLVQRWYSEQLPDKSPWRLYALSNLGSFLALLSYPFLLEPYLRLQTQVGIWSVLYAAFVLLCAWTALRSSAVRKPAPLPQPEANSEAPKPAHFLYWLFLAATTSTLLLATTNQISQEIAVNPFLWVAPLSLYLLTFVFTFDSDRFYRRTLFAVLTGIFAPAGCMVQGAAIAIPLRAQLALFLAALFVVCMLCHGELARWRPSPRYLTAYYLTIAAGGALGGAFVALAAPRIFTEFNEYPIALGAACILGLIGWLRGGALGMWTSQNFSVRIPLMALLLGALTAGVAAVTLTTNQQGLDNKRNFYGILRVSDRFDDNGARRDLRHGRILHGFQYMQGEKRLWPTTYYGPHTGVARVLNALDQPNRKIALVGLGAGTLAAWGRPGDLFRFYEINPDVEAIARTWFSYLKDSQAKTEVVLGDARVQLERELAAGQSHDFDAIIVDAFSSDSIPFHLLTTECGDLYRRRLAPGGMLLLHISNRVLNLEPVTRGLAQHLGWKSIVLLNEANDHTGESRATWVLATGNEAFLTRANLGDMAVAAAPITWTDDFASLWHVLE